MPVIHSRIIPFKGFTAINLFGLIFVRKGSMVGDTLLNHERIHTRQMLEMLVVFFYLWYLIEYLVRRLRLSPHEAYRRIRFEREAYKYESQSTYLRHRPLFAWLRRGI